MIKHDRNTRTRNRNDTNCHHADNNGHSSACLLLSFPLSWSDLITKHFRSHDILSPIHSVFLHRNIKLTDLSMFFWIDPRLKLSL